MNPSCATQICLCPCKCSRLEPLCLRTHILTSIRLAYNRCSCISTHAVRTQVCLSPCDCSHLEPLCIHTYAHKYAYIISQILLYINPCCALSYLFVPLQALTLRTSLYTYIYSQVLDSYHIMDSFVYEPMLCEITHVCALASAHTLKLVVYMP